MKEYEKFKLEWMIAHGYNLSDLISELQKILYEDDFEMDLKELFEIWENDYGFGCEIYPCYEEWLENEGKDI